MNLNNKIKITFGLLASIIIFNCGSSDDNDDCTKTIVIPQFFNVGNQFFQSSSTQEVPCDFPEPTEPVLTEPEPLSNFTYEVIRFDYTNDIENNVGSFQFEIKLNNNNNFRAEGVPVLFISSDGLEFSTSYVNSTAEPCLSIDANSSCFHTFETEFSLDIGIVESFQLLDVKYYLRN